MPRAHELVARLRAAGLPAVVSGAGPSVLAFLDHELDGDERKRMDSIAGETGIEWHISPLAIERRGASVSTAR
jgi:homoserine kinase